jgi:hypothetical protein
MSASNKELSRRFTEVFSTGDETLADLVLRDDVVFHGTTGDGELRGIEAMKVFVGAYRHAFPDAERRGARSRWAARHDRADRRREDRRGLGLARRAGTAASARRAAGVRAGDELSIRGSRLSVDPVM